MEFRGPDRVVIGTVGIPGERTFYLQAREGTHTFSIALEKAQASTLAERMVALLDQVSATEASAHVDLDPLALPIEEDFRAGALSLAWDQGSASVMVEAQALALVEGGDEPLEPVEPWDDDPAGPDTLRLWLSPERARAFAARTISVVAAGRPTCPFCQRPLDPQGHVCPRANGYLRRG